MAEAPACSSLAGSIGIWEGGRLHAEARPRSRDQQGVAAETIKDTGVQGVPLAELSQVLPSVPRSTLQRLLRELRDDGRIGVVGQRRAARWVPGSAAADQKHK